MRVSRFLGVLAVVALIATAASASTITWSGTGQSGTDPYGHGWQFNTQANGDLAWGIPGLGAGTDVWQGDDWISDFHITFFNLPDGVEIDVNPVPTSPFGFDESTRFSNVTDGALWNRSISGNHVDFWAANYITDRVDIGDEFFVNISFTGPVDTAAFERIGFRAAYTMTPEPSTLALAGLGLAGLGLAVRRRRRS